MLAIHWMDQFHCFELTNSCLLGFRTDDASTNYSMTCELQSTLDTSGIEWPALRNHILCMAHVIQLALGAFMSSLRVKGRTKSWEAHERNQQFGENEHIDIGKSQRLGKEGNARINKVSARRPALAKIIEIVRVSTYFGSPETDLHIAENACCTDYAATWLSRWVDWPSKRHSPHRSTTYYGCDDMLELDTGVASASLPSMGIYPRVALKSKIQRLPANFHNIGWMDHC